MCRGVPTNVPINVSAVPANFWYVPTSVPTTRSRGCARYGVPMVYPSVCPLCVPAILQYCFTSTN